MSSLRRGPLVALVTTLLLVAVVEGGAHWLLRWSGPQPEAARFLLADVWAHESNAFHRPHEMRSWAPVAGFRDADVRTNRFGFRGPEVLDPRRAGLLRVLALGDSSTFGFLVAEDSTFCHQLGLRLSSERTEPVEVINAGVVGYSSWQGRLLFEEIAEALGPDIVVVQFGYNDHHTAVASDALKTAGARPPTLPRWLRRSAFVRFVERGRDLSLRSEPVPRVGVSEFVENLDAIRRKAHEVGAACVFLTVPIRPTIPMVESFCRVEVDVDGRVETVWARQLDYVLGQFDVPTSDALREHFLGSGDIGAVVRLPHNAQRIEQLAREQPSYAAFHYLQARLHTALDDADAARRAFARAHERDEERRVLESYNDALREWAEAEDVPLIDLARQWAEAEGGGASWFRDVVHPNPAGHGVIADELAEWILGRSGRGR